MSELPEGIDPEIFEELHTSLAGLSLCHMLHRPADLWEILQLVKSDRAMVRGEIYRYDGLRDAYRAAGIARTIVQKLDGIRDRTGSIIKGLRQFLSTVPGVNADPDTTEFVIAFITMSPKGREAVAKWIADPAGQMKEAASKVTAITAIVEAYQRTLREFKPAPPPPSSPLDKESRPQLQPRFQQRETALGGSLIPSSKPVLTPERKASAVAVKEESKPAAPSPGPVVAESARPSPPAVAVIPPSPV